MKSSNLNDYIKYYLEKDKTKSAIMLDAPWGAGKSYYINQELIPFLERKENGGYSCVVISLYGISNLFDVSKSIYLEIRAKDILKKSEAAATMKIVAKTVFKGLTGRFNIDIVAEKEDLENLYKSIDLNKKLIIFEDIERSDIDIKKFLGYVNNLVEQDCAKVLLVANESEFINKDLNDTKNPNNRNVQKKEIVFTEETEQYLRIKEKTVSDTIHFECDYLHAFKNIIDSFDNDELKTFDNDDSIKEIYDIFTMTSQKNLRTFLYACQKTVEIFDVLKQHELQDLVTQENKKCVFYSIIYFSQKIKSNEFPKWESVEPISFALGCKKYPLHKFCYDYIRWHNFDKDDVLKSFNFFEEYRLYDQKGCLHDRDLDVIKSYYLYTEKEVLYHLNNISDRLNNQNDIPFYDYGKLLGYFIILNKLTGFDYTQCKEKMKNNIKHKEQMINADVLFLNYFEFDSKDDKKVYENFKNEFLQVMQNETNISEVLNYQHSKLNEFECYVRKFHDHIISKHKFISDFDIDKLVDFIFECNPSQLHEFRQTLFIIYEHIGRSDFVKDDCEFMKKLKENIKLNNKQISDKIVLKQIEWLCENLDTFIQNLSKINYGF